MKATVTNPWYRKEYSSSRPTYEIEASPCFQYRGVSVYRLVSSWLYVFEGMAITERAGFDKNRAPGIISDILDGASLSSYYVTKHLRAHGHKAREYDEFIN